MEENKEKKCNILFVGDYGIGKKRIGESFNNKVVMLDEFPGQGVFINIIKTCGQERYQTLPCGIMKISDLIILVYDITKKETFNNIKNIWYNKIENAKRLFSTDNNETKNKGIYNYVIL